MAGPSDRVCAVREVRARLPREAAIVLDSGDIAGFAMTTTDAYGPGSCTWVGGFGHLGVGIPYGIAAKLNDTAWGQVRHGQEATFGPDRTPGTGLGWRSYEKVVAALGGHGERIEGLDEIGPTLERAFASGLPVRVNVPTDPTAVFRGMRAMWPIT